MELFLVRHADAETLDVSGSDDSRALSAAGHEAMRAAARALARLPVRLERIYCSPLVRARQTAEHLQDLGAAELEVLQELGEAPSEKLLDRLRGSHSAAVGHAPWMDELCAWLTTGDRRAARGVPFRKGAIAQLEGQPRPGGMVLRAHFSPEVLEALGR